ncbi:ABC transporter permease [Paenibacillus hemerocallicola]|uniref:ABC transporter permease n=1 Tax=Paenibacillus hemerocallicola TaxID=1172614 RepID=A0A5C4TBZ1_9BACL|nr:FtsX-like permease family protein [Paenibacillus hemerocallicola]TNJ66402.1 ABC transporter permease [Paenibacillus hemerocallicola]
MKWKDQVRFVRQNMKKNKSRLFMTVLATAMGCAFLIVLASVGFGLQQSIVDKITGDRLVTAVDVWGKETNGKTLSVLNSEDIAYLRSVEHVKAVTYRNFVQQHLKPTVDGTVVSGGATIAVDFEAETKAGFGLSEGRLPRTADEIVIGYHVRETEPDSDETGQVSAATAQAKRQTAPAKEWIGKSMQLEVVQRVNGVEQKTPLTATVVGVAKKPSREWNKDNNIYIDEGLLQRIESITGTRLGAVFPQNASKEEPGKGMPKPLNEPRPYNGVQAIADNGQNVKAIGEQIRSAGYLNHSIANELEQVNMVFLIMKIGLVFVGTIAVLIASIGIFNTMTMAVTERAQDIGIMKAIGAHPSTIRRIFLLESGFIGLLGAIIGIVVSYALSIAVNAALPMLIQSFLNEQVPGDFRFSLIPPLLAVLAAVISLGVAVLSGARPAKRATQVDVLRALRRDV